MPLKVRKSLLAMPLFAGQSCPECGWQVRETNRKVDIGKEIEEFFENRLCRTSNEILKENYYSLNHKLLPGLY